MIDRREFDVLCAMLENPGASQVEIARMLGVASKALDGVYGALERRSLVDNGAPTREAMLELEPYKVENAVIMAAGLSSRFAPISYEKPKGLVSVRGEVLVERQIEMLNAAGVSDVVLVVGYKKELFFYLEEKYGVRIVVNDQFASRNNHSSLMCVKDMLGNTLICSSDDYFTINPFKPYSWKPWYSALYCEGPTDEWCLSIDGSGRITDVSIGGEDAWYMIGPAYFDSAFSERFAGILEREYDDPRTANKLWEQLFVEHIGEFDMEVRRQAPGTVYEFDSLDELRDFDPYFLENVDVGIFDNIASVLGCEKKDIRDVYPLKQGLTNLSCHFSVGDGEYVYRHPGVGTDSMIDRAAEAQALEFAKSAGIDNTFLFEDPVQGWKISRFIPDCRELDPHDDVQLAEAMAMARDLHGQGFSLDRRFDYFEESMKYESLLLAKGAIEVPGYAEMRGDAERLKRYADADGSPVCLTHNDFFNLNLLYDGRGRLSLIDWEYAGMSDYASDYGTFVVTCMLSEDEAERALEHYFGRPPSFEERRHNLSYVALAGWCWYLWALLKESEGDFVGEWLYTYYSYAKKYLGIALPMYEGVLENEGGLHRLSAKRYSRRL